LNACGADTTFLNINACPNNNINKKADIKDNTKGIVFSKGYKKVAP
jgi:hypothetical protein